MLIFTLTVLYTTATYQSSAAAQFERRHASDDLDTIIHKRTHLMASEILILLAMLLKYCCHASLLTLVVSQCPPSLSLRCGDKRLLPWPITCL